MHFPMMLWKFHDDLMHTCGSQQKWAGGRGGRPDTNEEGGQLIRQRVFKTVLADESGT